jgi:UDP-D-galactose:(glucosyl)LPS alpha-1,6-D-galactosyltransferase
MGKITVDIVSPYGGKEGGIENVIRSWTRNLNPDLFNLRVMHMTPGIAYLNGYKEAYYINAEDENVDASHCASGYNLLIEQFGAPDICIATNTPFMSLSCDKVRRYRNIDYKLFSWVHSEISRYREAGQGGVPEMLHADAHFVLNSSTANEILNADSQSVVYNIGNPILHDIPESTDIINNRKLVYVGRLSAIKRIDLILEAMYKAHSKWYLDIIGDGEIRNEIEGWIKLLKLESRVRLLGWKDNPLPFMSDAAFLISASEYEGFMITGAEALAMGKPVIGTPTEGLIEYVRDRENGFFFNFDDANSLVSLLDKIAAQEIELPTPESCKKSVEKYRKEIYFKNVESILLKDFV